MTGLQAGGAIESATPVKKRTQSGYSSSSSNHCILIVEDHEETAVALMRWLKMRSLRAVHACDAREALQILDDVVFLEARFAGILIDYRLPDGSGCHIAQAVLDEAPGTPLAMMTAYQDLTLTLWTRTHGIPIFEKPLQVSRLRDWLSGGLES